MYPLQYLSLSHVFLGNLSIAGTTPGTVLHMLLILVRKDPKDLIEVVRFLAHQSSKPRSRKHPLAHANRKYVYEDIIIAGKSAHCTLRTRRITHAHMILLRGPSLRQCY